MPTMYQTSISNILSFKVLLISSSVLSAAIMLTTTDFAIYIPSVYNGLISWLRPPYLYLVINCIIISIVASSKLQSNKDDASPSPITPSLGIVPPPPPVNSVGTGFSTAEYKYSSAVLNDSSGYEVMNKEEKVLDIDTYEQVDATRNEDLPFVVNSDNGGVVAVGEDATSNKENEFVVAKSMWNASENVDLREFSPTSVKPPVSARFSHRRNVKASPEGGRTVLGVSKPKKQDTLESTWKTITEGRSIPITRHLKKSDTWERDSRVHGHNPHPHPHQQEKTMKKAETFKDRTTNTGSPSPLSGGGSGKLRKEPSLSQDELNRRVEAFIKKFNEDMRLQRQESLNQYMEMINRGSH